MSLAARILPIFLLLALGWALRAGRFMDDATANALKLIVVRIVLPAVLFLSFVDLELRGNYLALMALVFGVCVAGLLIGPALLRMAGIARLWARFLMTGYEYGMLGVGLVAGTWGLAAVSTIAVVALGHELFIWFVFFALLVGRRDGGARALSLAADFARNPVVIAILAGLVLNVLGLHTAELEQAPIANAFLATLRMLAPLTAPLILLVIGHGLYFEAGAFGEVAKLVGLRLAVQLPLAALCAYGVVGPLGMEARFGVALATLMILPPPFIVPLFMPTDESGAEERRFVHRVLTVHTLISLVIFAGIAVLTPGL